MILLLKMDNFEAWWHCMKGQGRREGGAGGQNTWGPDWLGGGAKS